jgi:nitrogen fixation protein FixH
MSSSDFTLGIRDMSDWTEVQQASRRAAWRWGALIVALLGLQVAGGVIAIVLASGDESVAIVPSYHEKALNWDAEMAAQAASVALGWQCEVSQIAGEALPAGLRIQITDGQGVPVAVRSGELSLYRHYRAADVRSVAIPAGQIDGLEIPDCFDAPGLWQVMLELKGENGGRFLHSQELFVGRSDLPGT